MQWEYKVRAELYKASGIKIQVPRYHHRGVQLVGPGAGLADISLHLKYIEEVVRTFITDATAKLIYGLFSGWTDKPVPRLLIYKHLRDTVKATSLENLL
ncbi:hypothetical protein A0H81_00736 [Grifola frondosa]|uniref:Uncharacterized protein n=1 Tax=Grifola frondosa TaxID=5627 RepID=A0A1C7MQY6_GRIFR|nr:hypothetical protein A0H81_00736 [Grifola frondosa]